jgi:hypothetical protein
MIIRISEESSKELRKRRFIISRLGSLSHKEYVKAGKPFPQRM